MGRLRASETTAFYSRVSRLALTSRVPRLACLQAIPPAQLLRVPSGRGAPRSRSHVPSTGPCCRALSPASTRSVAGRFVREVAFSGGKCWLSRACPCLEPRFPASTPCSKPSAGVEARLRVARSRQGPEMSCLPAVCVCNAMCVWRRAGSGLNFTLVSRNFSTLYQRSNSTTT